MVARLGRALGRNLRVERVPKAVLALGGLFVPLLRELVEMGYQWDQPFVVDDRRFRERFGATPMSLELGAAETVAWAVAHYRS
jgi:hypothetical protein